MPGLSLSESTVLNHLEIILQDQTMFFLQMELQFFSPLNVDDFVKKSSIIYYSKDALKAIHKDIETFAQAEGLTAHANSIAVRFEEE